MITDGVTEAMNDAKDEFGDARFMDAVQQTRKVPPGQVLQNLFAVVDAFAGGVEQADDIGCLVIDRKSSA